MNFFEMIDKMTTVGDRVLNISLPKIGEKSLFTKDLEDALRNGIVDFVVHSLKDLPTTLPDGMAIGAVLEREDARDALVLAKQYEGESLKTLPEGSIIGNFPLYFIMKKIQKNIFFLLGTSSLRRQAQISRLYPNLKVHDIRGNLNTRLAKLDATDSKYAGIILAQAGLVRMGWHNRISTTIEPTEILYAVGQGALAVECRSSDTVILSMLEKLICHETQLRILAERSFLKTLGGGCSAPVAVDSILAKSNDTENTEYKLRIIGSVWSLDGKTEIQSVESSKLSLNISSSDDLDDIVVPPKRLKLSEADSGNASPPKVIDHSQLNFSTSKSSALNENLDIVGILNAHSDAFKKCPYSQVNKSTGSKETSNETAAADDDDHSLKCPLNFAVGQDVMGQCPYFDSIQDKEQLNKDASCSECPYKMGCVTTKELPESHVPEKDNSISATIDITKCPFLSASSSSTKDNATSKTENLINENSIEQLFCGIYPHRRWPLELFEKCEQIGKDLASKLIEKGALAVMECAQKEIHSKI